MARGRRPRRTMHAREELRPGLGFRGVAAYRGRRGQVRVGIGRGEVRGGEGGLRRCMQGLRSTRGLRRLPDVYGHGDVGSASSCMRSEAK
jgi:hypothetical protein